MDELNDISFSARRSQAPIDVQINSLKSEVESINRTLVRIDATQTKILDQLSEIETDRKLVGAATVATILISSLALIMSIVAVIAAFTIR